MKRRRRVIAFLSLLLIFSMQTMAFAHSGRTDSRGGHRDNKNKSGLGQYHYHCGGYPPHLHNGNVCPYKTTTSKKTVTETKSEHTNKSTPKISPKTNSDIESTQYKNAKASDKKEEKQTQERIKAVGAAVILGSAVFYLKRKRGGNDKDE